MKSLSCFLIQTILCCCTAFFSQAQGCLTTNPIRNRESISLREELSNKPILSNNELFNIHLSTSSNRNQSTTEHRESPSGELSEDQVTWSGRTDNNFFEGDNWIGKRKEPNRQETPYKSGDGSRDESSSRESNSSLDSASREQNRQANRNQVYQGKLPNENERALFENNSSPSKIKIIGKGSSEPYKIGGFEFDGGKDYSFDVKNQTIAFQEIGVFNRKKTSSRATSPTQTFNLSDKAEIIFEGSSHADSDQSETVNYLLENSTLTFKKESHADCAKIKSKSNGMVIQFHDNASADLAEFVLIGKDDKLEFGKDFIEGEDPPQGSASLSSAKVHVGGGTVCFKGNSRVGEPPKEKSESLSTSSSNSSSSDKEERDQKRQGNRGQATENLAKHEKDLEDNKGLEDDKRNQKIRKDLSDIIRKDSSKIISDSNQATPGIDYQINAENGTVKFLGTSHADSVKINAMNGTVHFGGQSHADNALIVVEENGNGSVKFDGSASADNSTITLEKYGTIEFGGYSTNGSATINAGSGKVTFNHERTDQSSTPNWGNDTPEKCGTINVQDGTVEFLGSSRAGWTTINRGDNGKIIFKGNSKAENATINGSVTFESGSASGATINIDGEKDQVAFQNNSQADASTINVAKGKAIFEGTSTAKQATINVRENGGVEFKRSSNAGVSKEGEDRTKITAENGTIQFTAHSSAGRAEIHSEQGTLTFDGTLNLSDGENEIFKKEKNCTCTAADAMIYGSAKFKRASAGESHIFLNPGDSIIFEAESTADGARIKTEIIDGVADEAEVKFEPTSKADRVRIEDTSVTFNSADAENATIILRKGNKVKFNGTSSAKAVTVTVGGGDLTFSQNSCAGRKTPVNKKSIINVETGGTITFEGESRAGNATITNNGVSPAYDKHPTEEKSIITEFGSLCFKGGSSAHEATIKGSVAFKGASDERMATAGNATITLTESSEKVIFADYATAGTAIIQGEAGEVIFIGHSNAGDEDSCNIFSDTSQTYEAPRKKSLIGVTTGSIQFRDESHAGKAELKVKGRDGYILFDDHSSAKDGIIISSVKHDPEEKKLDAENSSVRFLGHAKGGEAKVTVENGAYIYFGGDSNAEEAKINVNEGILLFDGKSHAGNAVIKLKEPPSQEEQGGNDNITNKLSKEPEEKGNGKQKRSGKKPHQIKDNKALTAIASQFNCRGKVKDSKEAAKHKTEKNEKEKSEAEKSPLAENNKTSAASSKLIFQDHASAKEATIHANTSDCQVTFSGHSTAGSATINVSKKAELMFEGKASGGQAKVFLKDQAVLSLNLDSNEIEFGHLEVEEGVTIDLGEQSKLKIGTKNEDNRLKGRLKGEKDSELIKVGEGTLEIDNKKNKEFHGTIRIKEGNMLLKDRLTGTIDLAKDTKLNFQSQQKNKDVLDIKAERATILFTGKANAGKATITTKEKSHLTFEQGTSGDKATINLKSGSTLTIDSNNEFGSLSSDATSTIGIGSHQLTVGREMGQKKVAEIAGAVVGEKDSRFIKVGKGTLRFNGNQNQFEGTLQLDNGTVILEKGVAGDLSFNGGNIGLTVDDLQLNSPIQIGGKVNIKEGKIKLIGVSNDHRLGKDYRMCEDYAILKGEGGIKGEFDSNSLKKSEKDIWLKQTFSKEKNTLYMTLLPDLSSAAQSKNQKSVAAQLDKITKGELENTPFLEELINKLVHLDGKEACNALNQMSGEQYATLLLANQKATERFLRCLYTPLRFITMDQDCEELCYNQYKCWGNLGGGNNSQESTQKAKGYEMNELVLALGIQRSLNYTLTECETLREMIPSYWLTGWTMGLAMSYGNQHFDFKKGESKAHSEAHNLEGAFYALFTKSSYYFLVDVVVGYWSGDLERSIHINDIKKTKAHGHPHMFQTTFYGELGFNNYSYYNIIIQPYLGIETGYYNLSEIKEKRGEKFNLKIDSHSTPITNTCLGVHLFKLYDNDCSWGLSADLAWKHLFHFDEELHAHLASLKKEFKVDGPNEDHNGFEGALTLFKALNKRWTISVELAGERWTNYSNLYFTANLSYKW
ncbi:MAG: autotransporter domain-containing protein [Chlamydiales bacterium]